MLGNEMGRTPAHAVDRPALREQLDAGLASPLSLIVAPAGAGKTVLLSQWAQRSADRPIAWLDVSTADGNALVFVHGLTEALQSVSHAFQPPAVPVAAGEGRLGEPYLEELAAALGRVGPVALVFDDLDRMNGSGVLTDLWRLVDLLPPSAHFVFASRTDLQLGWSRQRLHYGLVEIRQRELAFDTATTAQVLERIAGHPVSERTAAAVTTHTEGWAVGVQLTALTMRVAADPDLVVETMSGTDRLVTDYLSEEVLDALEPDRRTALIRLAVVDEVCAGLAEAITGIDGGQLLAELERSSMFVVPVVGRPGWYRFHRLFRDLLLLRLRAHERRAEAELLDAAAEWHLAESDPDAAIEYLLRARSWDRALGLILANGREFYDDQRMATVARWLSAVPEDVRAADVDADLLLAIAHGMSGHATASIDAFRLMLAGDRLSAGQRQIALAYLAACVQFHPQPELFLATARHALAALAREPDADLPDLLGLTSRPLLMAVSRVSLGRSLLFLGEVAEARHVLRSALDAVGMAYRPYRVHALGSLALADALLGRLVEATDHADEALALASEFGLLTHPSPADAYLARAAIAVQRGDEAAASLAVHRGALRAASNRRTQLMWVAWLISTVVDPDGEQSASYAPGGPRPAFVRDLTAASAMRAARLRGVPLPPPGSATTWSPIAFEEIAGLLTVGHAAAARSRLVRLQREIDETALQSRVECELLFGWLCAVEGRQGPACNHLRVALRLAEPEWLLRPFVRAGPRVAELIEDVSGATDAFRTLVIRQARAAAARREHPIEGLTPREFELLAYLPTRLTIADIAERCFVSTNTVKTHLGHIYRKLGVQSRDAAVDRATALGLMALRDEIPAF
jgi:LuxR family maltose regulon positive regulatory protein